VSGSFPPAPCFSAPKLVPCPHPDTSKFAWFARDDTVKSGQVYCVVCMSCNTVLFVGETQATRGLARIRAARAKDEGRATKKGER
jgi:hypothetical protein